MRTITWAALITVVVALVVGERHRLKHLTKMDEPQKRERTYPGGDSYDGRQFERAGGRRWFILRTGGAWK